MTGLILISIFFILAPAAVLWLCRRFPFLGKVGPVLILYILGLIVGNLFHPADMARVQTTISEAMVPLAIPLMLFGCTFKLKGTRSQLLALVTGLVSVMAAVVAGYFIFGRGIPDGAKIGGLLTGVYTGGTLNMASLQSMLGVPEETFILLNSYDMVISFLFLTFLLSAGIKLFRRFLPCDGLHATDGSCDCSAASHEKPASQNASRETPAPQNASAPQTPANPYKGLFTRAGIKDAAFLLGMDILVIALSAGIAMLLSKLHLGAFMTILILLLTTLGILASFWKPVKTRRYGYEIGMYFIYVFSIVVASMADISQISLAGGLGTLGYLTFVVFGSLCLQVLLAKIFRIDSDTMVISSVSFICSPPFVPMMAAAMKNRSILAAGLAIGVIGYALGNYLGFIIERLLSVLG